MNSKCEVLSENPYAELVTVTVNGMEFSGIGAQVTENEAWGYMSGDMKEITTAEGNHLGYARVTASWSLPWNCYISDKMYQVEGCINGIWYTGRTVGSGFIWHGKIMARSR